MLEMGLTSLLLLSFQSYDFLLDCFLFKIEVHLHQNICFPYSISNVKHHESEDSSCYSQEFHKTFKFVKVQRFFLTFVEHLFMCVTFFLYSSLSSFRLNSFGLDFGQVSFGCLSQIGPYHQRSLHLSWLNEAPLETVSRIAFKQGSATNTVVQPVTITRLPWKLCVPGFIYQDSATNTVVQSVSITRHHKLQSGK